MILVCINRIFLDFVKGNIGFVCWSTLYVSNNWILFSTVCVILFGLEMLVYILDDCRSCSIRVARVQLYKEKRSN